MGTEIERKFLVDPSAVPAELRRDGARFAQGYLSLEPVVRVRLSTAPNTPDAAWLTVKGPGGLSRVEFEYAIPPDDARAMLPLCGAVIDKTRYTFPVGETVWELDEFHGRFAGLWVAEVELDAPDAAFERPGWLGEEVTDDHRYSNAALALAKGVTVAGGRLVFPGGGV